MKYKLQPIAFYTTDNKLITLYLIKVKFWFLSKWHYITDEGNHPIVFTNNDTIVQKIKSNGKDI